ncbi:GNAT family N-acetyltransferase [Kribbella antibiotica]|uniref:GNAT family N-acetyltransferase n=1 Tax=Kribbella antibiotica TaxID=190195 RepID=A0A4R4Z5Z4_9ACTN|nr:GNAT family N-acetyltransferase [Kribbella antibiotica]TDD53558.1 GNAT family N-acetyltransferase [Kribbella antibiotica]
MTAVLPDTFTVRPPTKDDAQAVFDLVAAYNHTVVGFADYTLDDAFDELTEPGFEPETDGWLVFDGDQLVGYGSVFGKGEFHVLDMDAVTSDPVVEAYLLGEITRRGRELAAAHGHTSVQLDTGVYRLDTGRRARLEAAGYARGTTFHRMRIDHHGPVPAPAVPAGVVVRRGTPDEESQRAAHHVVIAAFTGQYGFEVRSFEEWQASHEAQSTFDWAGMALLEIDGKAVAMRECTDAFIEDENCNYVGRLAVLDEARGKGLAKFLLRDQFALDAAAGRTGTLLHVDTNNPTPALGLYLSVGMTESLVIDSLRCTVAV